MKCELRAVGDLQCDREKDHEGPHWDTKSKITWAAGKQCAVPWSAPIQEDQIPSESGQLPVASNKPGKSTKGNP